VTQNPYELDTRLLLLAELRHQLLLRHRYSGLEGCQKHHCRNKKADFPSKFEGKLICSDVIARLAGGKLGSASSAPCHVMGRNSKGNRDGVNRGWAEIKGRGQE